ncbi:MAG: holo-ACP synthase [Candidatus Latescibacterota bacterium]
MIIGIGMDIAKVERMEQAMLRHGERFRNRVFTPGEQAYCSRKHYPYESYAARFAVKEAVFKALGRGWSQCGGYTSIEVVSSTSGKPEVAFHGKAKLLAEQLGVRRAFITITHDAGLSAAVAILEG